MPIKRVMIHRTCGGDVSVRWMPEGNTHYCKRCDLNLHIGQVRAVARDVEFLHTIEEEA